MIGRVGRSSIMALLAAASACGFDSSAAGPTDGSTPDEVALDAGASDAPPADLPVTVRVEALIDGRSQLRLSGATVQWFHLEFAAPGRHGGGTLPTLIDGLAWFPIWPDPDGENRDCECASEVATLLDPPLPSVPSVATVTPIQVRNAALVIQQPTDANDFTTVVELDDTGEAGSETYIVDVEVAPESPE